MIRRQQKTTRFWIWSQGVFKHLRGGGVTFMETSWTRFLLSGLSKGTLSSGVPSTTSFPNMVPFSRIFLVRRRVSMPGEHGNNGSFKRCTCGSLIISCYEWGLKVILNICPNLNRFKVFHYVASFRVTLPDLVFQECRAPSATGPETWLNSSDWGCPTAPRWSELQRGSLTTRTTDQDNTNTRKHISVWRSINTIKGESRFFLLVYACM